MKNMNAEDILTLRQLTKVRELDAVNKLQIAASRRRDCALEVEQLVATKHEAVAAEQIQGIAKWHLWKSAEVSRRNTKLASAEAEFRLTLEQCSRAIAQSSVAEILDKRIRLRARQ